MSRKFAFAGAVLIILLLTIRVPAWFRPVSKHHEFNTAVILINAVSWQQAGGGALCFFTPFMNFQLPTDKLPIKGPHIDHQGNHVYLSFGAGWYLLPYAVFKALGLPPSAWLLRLLSIVIGLFSSMVLFKVLHQMFRDLWFAFFFTALFVLLPDPLWYMGVAYVSTAIVIPLVVWFLSIWHRISIRARSPWLLVEIGVAGIGMIYIDWIGVFLLAGMGIWALVKFKDKLGVQLLLTCAFTALAGLALVFGQFVAYLGWEPVVTYWQMRFAERGVAGANSLGPFQIFLKLSTIHVSGYLPLFIFFGLAAPFIRWAQIPKWLWWTMGSLIVYHLVFLNWSVHHAFAWLSFYLLGTIILAHGLFARLPIQLLRWSIAVGIWSLSQYFLINLPGPTSLKGVAYHVYQKNGQTIRRFVHNDAWIFTNFDNNKITEWYARRTFYGAASKKEALQLSEKYALKKVWWAEFEQERLVQLKRLK